jgi:hypothetical protein
VSAASEEKAPARETVPSDEELLARVQGEVHVAEHTPNVIDFWQRWLEFLDEHLHILRNGNGKMLFNGERAKSRRIDGYSNLASYFSIRQFVSG